MRRTDKTRQGGSPATGDSQGRKAGKPGTGRDADSRWESGPGQSLRPEAGEKVGREFDTRAVVARGSSGLVIPVGPALPGVGPRPVPPGSWGGLAWAALGFVGPAVLLLALVAGFYADTVSNPLISDDYLLIDKASGGALQAMRFQGGYRFSPANMLLLWAQHAVWGVEPVGYHWMGLLLLGLTGILTAALGLRLGLSRPASWVAAGLVVSNGLIHEIPLWACAVSHSASTCFYLGALLAFLAHLRRGQGSSAITAILLFDLALLTHEQALSLPLAAVLLLVARRSQDSRALRAFQTERSRGPLALLLLSAAGFVALKLRSAGDAQLMPGLQGSLSSLVGGTGLHSLRLWLPNLDYTLAWQLLDPPWTGLLRQLQRLAVLLAGGAVFFWLPRLGKLLALWTLAHVAMMVLAIGLGSRHLLLPLVPASLLIALVLERATGRVWAILARRRSAGLQGSPDVLGATPAEAAGGEGNLAGRGTTPAGSAGGEGDLVGSEAASAQRAGSGLGPRTNLLPGSVRALVARLVLPRWIHTENLVFRAPGGHGKPCPYNGSCQECSGHNQPTPGLGLVQPSGGWDGVLLLFLVAMPLLAVGLDLASQRKAIWAEAGALSTRLLEQAAAAWSDHPSARNLLVVDLPDGLDLGETEPAFVFRFGFETALAWRFPRRPPSVVRLHTQNPPPRTEPFGQPVSTEELGRLAADPRNLVLHYQPPSRSLIPLP